MRVEMTLTERYKGPLAMPPSIVLKRLLAGNPGADVHPPLRFVDIDAALYRENLVNTFNVVSTCSTLFHGDTNAPPTPQERPLAQTLYALLWNAVGFCGTGLRTHMPREASSCAYVMNLLAARAAGNLPIPGPVVYIPSAGVLLERDENPELDLNRAQRAEFDRWKRSAVWKFIPATGVFRAQFGNESIECASQYALFLDVIQRTLDANPGRPPRWERHVRTRILAKFSKNRKPPMSYPPVRESHAETFRAALIHSVNRSVQLNQRPRPTSAITQRPRASRPLRASR